MEMREKFIQILTERGLKITEVARAIGMTTAPLINFKNGKSGMYYETAKQLNRLLEVADFEPCRMTKEGLAFSKGYQSTKGVIVNEFEEGDIVMDLENNKVECKITSCKYNSNWSRWDYKVKNSETGLSYTRPEHHLKLKYKNNHVMPAKHDGTFEKAEPYNEENLKDAYLENMVRDAMVDIEELKKEIKKPVTVNTTSIENRLDAIEARLNSFEEKRHISECVDIKPKTNENAKEVLMHIVNSLLNIL